MSDYYCDFANGDDSTGAGTAVNPWKTVTKCLTVADGGDTTWIGDGAAQVLAAQIAWGGAKTTSSDLPIIFRGWEYLAGAAAPGIGEIDGNDAVANLFATANKPPYCIFIDLILHRVTGSVLVVEDYWTFYNCEIYDAGSDGLGGTCLYTTVVGCHIHDVTTSAAGGSTGFTAMGCHIHDCATGLYAQGLGSVCLFNIVHDVTDTSVLIGGKRTGAYFNTIDRTAQVAGDPEGIYVDSGSDLVILIGNLITHHGADAGGGAGIRSGGTAHILMQGHNHFFGNTADEVAADKYYDLGNDKVGDPEYADRANCDYSVGGSPAEMGWPVFFLGSPTRSYLDVGAVQRREDWTQRRTLIDEDMYVDGVLQPDTLQPSDGSFSDSHVALNAGFATSKMRHKHIESYGQTGAAADETKLIHLVSGATATSLRFSAGSIGAPTTGSVTVDLKKGGVSILAAAITIGAVDRVLTAATIDTPASVAGDWLEVVFNDTASDATGVFAQLEIDEDAPA